MKPDTYKPKLLALEVFVEDYHYMRMSKETVENIGYSILEFAKEHGLKTIMYKSIRYAGTVYSMRSPKLKRNIIMY